jgi:hypothetical protein
MEMVRVLKKNPSNQIFSRMYEILDLMEAHVVWKITVELNKSHETKIPPKYPKRGFYRVFNIFFLSSIIIFREQH